GPAAAASRRHAAVAWWMGTRGVGERAAAADRGRRHRHRRDGLPPVDPGGARHAHARAVDRPGRGIRLAVGARHDRVRRGRDRAATRVAVVEWRAGRGLVTPALELCGVDKRFGATPILNGVSLTVEAGERHAIIGPNGAGKSTLFNVVSGALAPTRGSIRLHGEDIAGAPPY